MFAKILKDSDASRKAWETRRRSGKTVTEHAYGTNYKPAEGKAKEPKKLAIDPAVFKRSVRRISQLTDDNDHGLAIAHGAKLLGMDSDRAEAMKLRREHIKVGHPTPEITRARNKVYARVMARAKEVLPEDQYKAFYMAL